MVPRIKLDVRIQSTWERVCQNESDVSTNSLQSKFNPFYLTVLLHSLMTMNFKKKLFTDIVMFVLFR